MSENQYVASSGQKIAYSVATFGNSILGAVLTVFTFFYYKEIVFINLIEDNELIISALLGTALAIGWWIQAIMNPIAGWLSDKIVSSRFGRRKLWLIIGSPIMAISFIAIFLLPAPATEIFFPIIWLTIFNGIFNGAYAATVVVYLSLMPAISPTPEERTSISSYRTGFYLVGYILGALIGALLQIEEFVFIVVVVLSIIMVLGFYIAAYGIKEPEEMPEIPTFGIFEALKVTIKNKPFLPYLGFTIFATAFQSMLLGALPVFGKHVIYAGEDDIIASFIPGAFVITGILAVAPAMIWINRVGKKKAVIYSMLIATVITSLLFTVGFVPGLELPLTLAIVLILGIPAAPLLILPDATISDITDYDEMVTGTRREAMHFASQGLLTRFAGGISVQLMGLILGTFGATYNAAEAFNGTLGLLLIGPAASIFLVIGVFFFRSYPEDEVLEACAKKGSK
jgi:GPH family glycoside/pentoside/hexuronide:cation symporter